MKVLALLLGVGVLASGCGHSGSSGGSGHAGAAAYSACMRTNGVASFPDPGADGRIQIPGTIDERSPTYQAASRKCRGLAPGGVLTKQAEAQLQQQMLAFAACMRAHGVTQFPDPLLTQGHIEFNDSHIDGQSPTFTRAAAACRDRLSAPYFSKLS